MSFLMTRQGMTYALGALCAMLCAVIVYEFVATDGPTLASVAPPFGSPTPPPAPIKTLPPIDTYAEVAQRPLFSPTRQPAPLQATPDVGGNVNGFFLTSIVVDGGQRLALIQHGRPPVLSRVTEGQSVEGWTVQTIESERVVLQRAGTAQELKLKDRPPTQRQPGPGSPEPQPQPQPPLQFQPQPQSRPRGQRG